MMSSPTYSASPLPAIVAQHVEEAATLRLTRSVLVRAPHIDLAALARADDRLVAHLDGCAVAGESGLRLAAAAWDASPGVGECFVVAVRALEVGNAALLAHLNSQCKSKPVVSRAVASAMGWVSATALKGWVAQCLAAPDEASRALGLTACAMHRVAPGHGLAQAVQSGAQPLRATGWRVAVSVGACELADVARDTLRLPADQDAHADLAGRAAAMALTFWGEGRADAVRQRLTAPDAGQTLPPAHLHRLAILSAPAAWGREEVRRLGALPEGDLQQRRMIQAAGWLGDPQIVPWLIHRMADPVWGRVAGEAFSVITGADLDQLGLYTARPEAFESDPREEAENEEVDVDEDEGLLWPDATKVQAWWRMQAHRFVAGQRYFVGAPVDVAQVDRVLRAGTQRQRQMAAEHRCLMSPSEGLFPVAAPAWRQSRWLQR